MEAGGSTPRGCDHRRGHQAQRGGTRAGRGPHGAWQAPASPPASSERNMTEARREGGGGHQAEGRKGPSGAEPAQRRGQGRRRGRQRRGRGGASPSSRRGCGSAGGRWMQRIDGKAAEQPCSGVQAGGQPREPSPASSERNMTEACRGRVAGPRAGQHWGEARSSAARTGPTAERLRRDRRGRSATCRGAAPEESQ